MNFRMILLILASVTLSALAQLSLKIGMSGKDVQQQLARGFGLQASLVIAGNAHVLFGLLLYGVGAVLWLLVLARLDLSVAYPFVGLGFLLTMALGALLLGEPVGWTRLAGTLLVGAGVMLVART